MKITLGINDLTKYTNRKKHESNYVTVGKQMKLNDTLKLVVKKIKMKCNEKLSRICLASYVAKHDSDRTLIDKRH